MKYSQKKVYLCLASNGNGKSKQTEVGLKINEKKTGKPILIMGQTDQIKTSKGVTKAWKNENFTGCVKGIGTILMSYDPKKPHKKSCVLSIENFQASDFNENQTEKSM